MTTDTGELHVLDREAETKYAPDHQPNRAHDSFLLDSVDKGYSPQVKQQVLELSLNGSGVCDTAQVLGISPTPVIQELKKKGPPSHR